MDNLQQFKNRQRYIPMSNRTWFGIERSQEDWMFVKTALVDPTQIQNHLNLDTRSNQRKLVDQITRSYRKAVQNYAWRVPNQAGHSR